VESNVLFRAGGLAAFLLKVLPRRVVALTRRKHAQAAPGCEVEEHSREQADLRERNASLGAEIGERTTELRQARAELEQTGLRLQELSSRIVNAQEQERRHIARELHDETGQDLTLLRMHLADLAREGDPEGTRIADCIALVTRATEHIRGVALGLRPPMLDDLGLFDAVEWALEQQTAAVGWRGTFEGTDVDRRFGFDIETACFRIAQEALTNAARYSHASEVRVTLGVVAGQLELAVADNGHGFDLERSRTLDERKKHFGLVSMSDRAGLAGGRLEVDTAAGCGTRVRVAFPLPQVQAGALPG
jgi:signal transduction histidine kinase